MKYLTKLAIALCGLSACGCAYASTDVTEIAIVDDNGDNKLYTVVEQTASFPGGDQALFSFIGNNLHYPSEAAEAGIQGKVIVSFVVEKDGSISQAKVIRSVDTALDAEALRVVKKLPKWVPGRNNGKPVRSQYVLPISFRLQN